MNLADMKVSGEFFGIHARPERRITKYNPTVRAWEIAKRITLMFLLAGSFMFYYLLDKINQAISTF